MIRGIEPFALQQISHTAIIFLCNANIRKLRNDLISNHSRAFYRLLASLVLTVMDFLTDFGGLAEYSDARLHCDDTVQR